MAHRGTLFLDEIGELDLGLQAKLLQLLQDGQFCRIGAHENKRVDARVVCATNRKLEAEVEAGNFREDLFYRIDVLRMELPPLRERRGDIPGLVKYFLATHSREFGCEVPPLSAPALQLLQHSDWPGNIRQLENVIKRYVVMGSEEVLTSELEGHRACRIEPDFQRDGFIPLKKITRQAVMEIERKAILKALDTHHWNRKQAARTLKISYRALLYKIRDAGLPGRKSATEALLGKIERNNYIAN